MGCSSAAFLSDVISAADEDYTQVCFKGRKRERRWPSKLHCIASAILILVAMRREAKDLGTIYKDYYLLQRSNKWFTYLLLNYSKTNIFFSFV